MAMDIRRSSIAALLFLTLVAVALAAARASGGDDAAAAAAAVEDQQCRPLAYMPQLGAALAADDDEQQAGYMLVGMQTGGIGDKTRLVVVADQRYFFVTGYASGLSSRPRWTFQDGSGDRHRLLPLHDRPSSHGSSHAEVVASNVRRVLWNAGSSCG